jgi:hypothetical protein
MVACEEVFRAVSSKSPLFCCAVVIIAVSLSTGAFAQTAQSAGAEEAVVAQAPDDSAAESRLNDDYDPFEQHWVNAAAPSADLAVHDPFADTPLVRPVNSSAPQRLVLRQVEQLPLDDDASDARSDDPCAAAAEKPLGELTINIRMPDGELPRNYAAACWEEIDTEAGPLAASRYWPMFNYHWNATCFCHRPLYFEEVNLERYGYGCHPCLQPAASAAHFFATVPALPYCMSVDCPGECVYTLGHYRPGSCPPWRPHYPPCDAVAGAAEAGVLTGLIFLIP